MNRATNAREEKNSFTHKGKQCAATLHLPEHNLDERLPVILMVHGWGGTQLLLIENFIKNFNQLGIAVLTFDYPSWGESEGLPRNIINPWTRVQVVKSALCYLKSHNTIDSTKIILWGTSFGGGHVIDIAAEHNGLIGAIAQVPMLDGRAPTKATPLSTLVRFAADATVDLLNPFKTRYIPIFAEAGSYASMNRDGVERLREWADEHLDYDYDNRVAAKSLLSMAFYRPITRLSSITIPTLIIGANNDTVAPFNFSKTKRLSPKNIEVHCLDGNHFDPYFEPCFTENISIQMSFIKRLLA